MRVSKQPNSTPSMGHNGLDRPQLKSFVERIEQLEEERAGLAEDVPKWNRRSGTRPPERASKINVSLQPRNGAPATSVTFLRDASGPTNSLALPSARSRYRFSGRASDAAPPNCPSPVDQPAWAKPTNYSRNET
jgi:hypothetical protein